MMGPVTVKHFAEPAISESEILRYAGCRGGDEATVALMRSCLDEARPQLTYRACARELCGTELNFLTAPSHDMARYLSDCGSAILLSATVGLGLDRLIAKYGRVSPSRALMMQAIGAERVEALCDAFCREVETSKKTSLKPRFSPGYGDLPLETQKHIFTLLDCAKHIGLTLNDSFLMSPTKSVTAVVGVRKADVS